MPRRYVVTFENVSISAAQDLFQIKGAAGKILRIIGVKLGSCGDTTLQTAQGIETRARYLPVTVTDGSGGSTPTPAKLDPGDAAASFTALANNTSKATTNGTAITVHEGAFHNFQGEDYTFPDPPIVGPSESFVYELLSTVSGTCHMSGKVIVEELGG
jgi:hypothetical protein